MEKNIKSLIGVANSCPNSLEILEAQNNALVSLTKEMFSGLKLKALSLNGNKLITIEERAFANLIDLEYLDLRANRIISLSSKVFSTLYKLNRLDLSENQLKEIHPQAFYGLSSLETLILRENAIEAIRYSFTPLLKIKELDLSSNKIRGIHPSAFSSNRNLENLFLTLNKLTRLDKRMFLGLNNLNELTLDGNQISTIEEGTFKPLIKLEKLLLFENRLTFLNQYILSGLVSVTDLYLKQNLIQSIEDHAFRNMSNLQILDLRQNKLVSIEWNTFSGLTYLTNLDLSMNQLVHIHTDSLQHIVIQNCELHSNEMPCSCSYIAQLASLNVYWLQSDCTASEDWLNGTGYFVDSLEWTSWESWKQCGIDDCSKNSLMRSRSCESCSGSNSPLCVQDGRMISSNSNKNNNSSKACYIMNFKMNTSPTSVCSKWYSSCVSRESCSVHENNHSNRVEEYMTEGNAEVVCKGMETNNSWLFPRNCTNDELTHSKKGCDTKNGTDSSDLLFMVSRSAGTVRINRAALLVGPVIVVIINMGYYW